MPKLEIHQFPCLSDNFGVLIRDAQTANEHDFHPAPRRQFVVTLFGIGEIVCGDGSSRRFGRRFASGRKTPVRHRQRLRTRDANHGKSSFTQWRGDRGDGVIKHASTRRV